MVGALEDMVVVVDVVVKVRLYWSRLCRVGMYVFVLRGSSIGSGQDWFGWVLITRAL